MNSKTGIFAVAIAFLNILSCTHKPIVSKREIAGDLTSIEKPHPCAGSKGVPFRKYSSFKFDPTSGKIFGVTSSQTDPAEITGGGKTSGDWKSLDEFLEVSGVGQACGLASARKTEKPNRPNTKNGFQVPITKEVEHYYSPLKYLNNQSNDLKKNLAVLINKRHLQKVNQPDVLVDDCPAEFSQEQVCVSQLSQNYTQAREKLMGQLDFRKNEQGESEVFDFYCQKWIGEKYFREFGNVASDFPGENKIAHVKVVNCEHTWPQSKFTAAKKSRAADIQKTDLHHLYTTNSALNNLRANFEFGEVMMNSPSTKFGRCGGEKSEAALGPSEIGDSKAPIFEPPAEHKGNVARSLFYFAVKYGATMSAQQEKFLKAWNHEDPVDDFEKTRTERIYFLSGVRNPFVDYPEMADQVQFSESQAEAQH